jgi:uncharacterized protein (UPF0548 family)
MVIVDDFTYPEVGVTQHGALPAGYRHVRRRSRLGIGGHVFKAAVNGLRRFDMQRGSGLAVRASAPEAAVGVEVASGMGMGRLRLWAPCRVIWVEDKPLSYGYGYGTLPGHPEAGEEAFIVALDSADEVWFEIRAFSRPARRIVALAGPASHLVQDYATNRYVSALRRLATVAQ